MAAVRPATGTSIVGRELFARKGFDATSVADIAAEAGVGWRTFDRFFPAKE